VISVAIRDRGIAQHCDVEVFSIVTLRCSAMLDRQILGGTDTPSRREWLNIHAPERGLD
jgi:hypothetical protein